MKIECRDRETILKTQEPEQLAALEAHAQHCAACRKELRAWNDMTLAARTMHREWETPYLWPRIQAHLEAEARAEKERSPRWGLGRFFRGFALHWQTAAAVLVLLAVTATSMWVFMAHRGGVPPDTRRLLTDQALREAQTAETAYVQSIDKLASLAEPKLAKADTPLLVNYREKLLVLDSAIAECRRQIEMNRYNAHLQRELLSIYQEKQRTLEEVLRED